MTENTTDHTTDHTTGTTFRPAGPPLTTWPAAPAPDTPSAVITALWARMQARDWSGVAALLAPDAVVDWPVSGERLPDREAYVAVNAAYPEGWTVQEPRVIAQGSTVVSEVRVDHEEVGTHVAVSFWTVENGLITSGREYWTMPGSDPSPPWRAPHVRPL
ncbi:nuclear transport factor 2 family protein [Streptomyces albidoflavus]|uniref:nuclear transport factor 2 family protein n=1 Tax=Streptomyces albidoflavus TaxID=1886 RepID=UPI0013EEAEAD|nr:nuclear transport factor 2 family protein [Streptomyces albidoflavus]WTC36526.1 nuclear transport factor 2 family protein [Streptomyces albidoflavus]